MKKVSPQLKDLISRMLMPDRVRITISDIYEHPWMKTEDVNTENLKLNYGRIMNFSKFSKVRVFLKKVKNLRRQLYCFTNAWERNRKIR